MGDQDQKLREVIWEQMKPAFESMINQAVMFANVMMKHMPEKMPYEDKLNYIKGVLDTQQKALVNSMNAMTPNDFVDKVKEATRGRG